MNNLKSLKAILPDYPRTKHVPFKPNTARGDLLATEDEISVIFSSDKVEVTEKVDGSNCAMALYEGHPVIRNVDHILNKGYVKDTPAKKQFASVFNWFHEHIKQFEMLDELGGPVGVYGEWMVAQHGLEYDKLPCHFIAFDLYDYACQRFIETAGARQVLLECGFTVVPQLHYGTIQNYEQLEALANQPSDFTTKGLREGVYVKVSDDSFVTHRFKLIREGFIQGGLWDKNELKRNKLV